MFGIGEMEPPHLAAQQKHIHIPQVEHILLPLRYLMPLDVQT